MESALHDTCKCGRCVVMYSFCTVVECTHNSWDVQLGMAYTECMALFCALVISSLGMGLLEDGWDKDSIFPPEVRSSYTQNMRKRKRRQLW